MTDDTAIDRANLRGRRRPPGRRLLMLLGGLGLVYAGYAALVYSMQRSILFPGTGLTAPEGVAASVPGLQQDWVVTDGVRAETWWLPPDADTPRPHPAVIFAHGNGELIDFWPPALAPYRELGLGVLLVEYPGYGRSTGTPSQASIQAVMTAAYDRLVGRAEVDPRRIVLHGRSLGGGAVAGLADSRASAAIILQSTFRSVRSFAASMGLPGAIVRDPFDVEAVVSRYAGPLLLLHGERDRIVPVGHARRLKAVARSARLVLYPCGHNDFPADWKTYWDDIRAFLGEHGLLGR